MPKKKLNLFQRQTPMTISRAAVFIRDGAEELLHFQKEEIYASVGEAKV